MLCKEVTLVYRKLGKNRARGMYHEAQGLIEIDSRLEGKEHLEVLIHECLHLLQPYLDEPAVAALGVHLSEILFADGYRKVEE